MVLHMGWFLTILSEKQISDLLNQYGPMSLISYFNYNYNKYFFYPAIEFHDLTGDGINELNHSMGKNIYLFL